MVFTILIISFKLIHILLKKFLEMLDNFEETVCLLWVMHVSIAYKLIQTRLIGLQRRLHYEVVVAGIT